MVGVRERERTQPVRPALRGVIHRYAAVAFAAAIVAVALMAPDRAAVAWVAIYGVCVTAMLTVSATYHSRRLPERARPVLKRVDHATILLAIAGSYTGVVGLALGGSDRTRLLVVVWVLAVIGMVVRMAWLHAPYPLTAAVYVAVGWSVFVDIGAVVGALTGGQFALVLLGGLLYSAGAVVYALHRPNPSPDVFGYHEVFHALVTAAVAAHLVAVISLVAARPA